MVPSYDRTFLVSAGVTPEYHLSSGRRPSKVLLLDSHSIHDDKIPPRGFCRSGRLKHGFTLIELLLVIAIIAILALIALPNMLEAQTRAKVARVKSDLRTVVLGLETYRVDYNAYPTYHYVPNLRAQPGISFHIGGRATAVLVPIPFAGPNPITSPIAYLSTFPNDVFGAKDPAAPEEADEFYYSNWDYALTFAGAFEENFRALQSYQGQWRLFSPGPDLGGPDFNNADKVNIPYDPTNGTVSMGDIARFQRV